MVLPFGQCSLGILITCLSLLPHPGQPADQDLPGVVVSKIRLQALYFQLMLAVSGLPARCEQFPVISKELVQLIQPPLTGQPPGQVTQSVRVSCPGAPPKLVHMAALGQPASQPELSDVVASVGHRTDHRNGLVDLAPVGQPAGKLTLRVAVFRLSMLAKFTDAVVLGQHICPPPSCLILGGGIL